MKRDEAAALFAYEHLPPHLQEVSKPFFVQAGSICKHLPGSNYRTKALWKLWESKNLVVAALAQGKI